MNEWINLIRDNFSAFIEVMLFIPFRFQIRYVNDAGEVAVLVVVLGLAVGVVFLSARWMEKYSLGFTASVLLTFLVLSLTLGLTGFLFSIPRLSSSLYDTFPILCIGSPVFNFVLGVIASLAHRLRSNQPIVGTLLLCGTGFVFAYVLFTTLVVFFLSLYNN